MNEDALKSAEAKGYSKGYSAGKRRKARAVPSERQLAVDRALWQRAMIAALPFALTQTDWEINGKKITSLELRIALAGEVADKALDMARRRERV